MAGWKKVRFTTNVFLQTRVTPLLFVEKPIRVVEREVKLVFVAEVAELTTWEEAKPAVAGFSMAHAAVLMKGLTMQMFLLKP